MAKAASTTFDRRITGKYGNLIFQRDRRGHHYARAARVGKRPPTARQALLRANLHDLAYRWKYVLTQTQRDGWDFYVARDITYDDRITGQQCYIGNNAQRLLATADADGFTLNPVIIDNPPPSRILPSLGTPLFETFDGDPTGYLDWFTFSIFGNDSTAEALLIWTAPLNWTGGLNVAPDKTYPFPLNRNAYRYADTLIDHDAPPFHGTQISFRLPFTPHAGDFLSIRTAFSDRYARNSPPRYFSARTQT